MQIVMTQLFRNQCFGDTEIKITAIINSFLNHAAYSNIHCIFLNIISGKLYSQHNNKISHKEVLMGICFLKNASYFFTSCGVEISKDKTKRHYLVYLTVPAHRKDCEQRSNWSQRILLLPELFASHQPGKYKMRDDSENQINYREKRTAATNKCP